MGGGEKIALIKNISASYGATSFVRSSGESRRHSNLILKLATAYRRAGFDVKADHVKGFDRPEKISLIVPDIIATKEEKKIIVEIETRNSIGTERDRKQRRRFGEWAKKNSNRDFRREVTF